MEFSLIKIFIKIDNLVGNFGLRISLGLLLLASPMLMAIFFSYIELNFVVVYSKWTMESNAQ